MHGIISWFWLLPVSLTPTATPGSYDVVYKQSITGSDNTITDIHIDGSTIRLLNHAKNDSHLLRA